MELTTGATHPLIIRYGINALIAISRKLSNTAAKPFENYKQNLFIVFFVASWYNITLLESMQLTIKENSGYTKRNLAEELPNA